MKKNYTPEEKRNFKIKMAEWVYDLSICVSGTLEPMSEDKIVAMVEMLVRLIEANNMSFELQPYSNSIRMIASGDTEITTISRLNVVGLMKIFREEHQRFMDSKQPEKW